MTRGIFITGTDTGIGKTLVASGLVHLLAARDKRVVGLKPVASGAIASPDGLRNADAVSLAAAGSVARPYALTNPHCFAPAIAPHLAAADAGVAITAHGLVDWYAQASRDADFAIVEGAGGWRVPLHPGGFLSDLPERLGLEVVLVVGLRLGCLNHARLTAEAIESARRCSLLGWVGNRVDPGFARPDDNLATLAGLLGGPALAVLPPLASTTAVAASECLERPALLAALGLPPRSR